MKSLLLILFLFCSQMINAQLDKMEPPFWWADMKLEKLQILFYGQNIAQYEVAASEGIKIIEVKKTENPNYLFVTINSKDLQPGEYQFHFKSEGKTAFSQPYTINKRKKDSALRKGFDSSDLIYLLMPDRFANGDPANDTHKEMKEEYNRTNPGGRHGGDIIGIIDHLDYLEDLGATAVWSTPLCEDNDKAYSYHTYAQSDVYRIDPRYGTNEDYAQLASELHKRDMKLIMDYVTNHWGSEHWLIKDLPTYDWIHQFPGYENTNYRMTTQYDPNTSQIDKKYNEDGWFVRSMPDLNQSHPLVLQYLIQNAIWWIEFADLDGLRVDTYSYNEKEGIAKWTEAIMDEYPNFNIVGEVWLHDSAQIAYWQKDSPIGAIQDYNSHLPTVMDFTLHDAIGMMFFEEKSGWNQGVIKAYENFVNDFLYPDINNILVFTENHDTQRINTLFKGDIKKYKLATTLIATTRGIPQIYYGSEIGMQGDKAKGDGDIRRDFPGGWAGDSNNAFVKQSRTKEQEAYHSFSKKLFNWRKNTPVIHTGRLLHYIPENNVYVYFRIDDNQRIMVVLNNNPKSQSFDLDRFTEGLDDAKTGKEVFSGENIDLSKSLTVPGKIPMIIELNK